MKFSNYFYWLLILILINIGCEQKEPIALLPIPVTNNAVCGIEIEGKKYVYSFGGLGAGKTHSDITLRSFRLDIDANVWTEIEALPDTMPKIAAAASVVDGKIYIVGGYHVFPDGHEKSSAKVHVFDPMTNTYLDNADDIPTAIDDQVQSVWKDSLIYVATGWSDSLNVGLVQVFNPALNQWRYGTSLPDDYSYKVFGGSGTIIGDKLFYAGGAGNRQHKDFPIQSYMRTGEINPEDPLEILWQTQKIDDAGIYRSGVIIVNNQPAWIGGASLSYNYNGIAYTKQPAEPLAQILIYDGKKQLLKKYELIAPPIMDMRGVAQFDDVIIVAGGMEVGQQVSNKVYRVNL
jgi:N-acetylneuraminic acid mutarotase